ncbi:MAG: MarR family transcriptional regulator [Desulfobacteraceae bacterium]|nr:MAG: MarR family transcriptional regulator [Desulfobacteraceae bacterium]
MYIFIDDFSELPRSDMEQVVDTILAPFNNWSEEFIKLKIAVYPGRVYPGNIDLSKVDEIYLDIYRSYGRNDVSGMEVKAIDFTMRLVTQRLLYFCKEKPEVYFESESEDFWRIIFESCLGNPRILGYILYYCYETSIIYGQRIGVRTIQAAARRYYEEKIYQYFRLNKFLHETFEERSSIYSLKELLEEIVKRAKELRSYRESKVMSEISGRPPTSHFHVLAEYDQVLSTLELNFFLTKYYEMRDRDGREVSVYALNYGLCQQQTISFGRPREKREQRLYFVERIFDYSPIIASYIKVNQEIVCGHCSKRHPHEMLPAIQAFDMLCPECKKGTCKIINLSRKYEKLINSVSEENLLPDTELGILKTLHDERKQMFAKEIAEELDCSYQLIGKRGRNLAERDLVERSENEKGRRVFEISSTANEMYFSETPDDQMDFGEN